MVNEDTYTSILDPDEPLHTPRSHRREPRYSFRRPLTLLIILVISSPLLVTSVLPDAQDAPRKPLSVPYTAQTYAPYTFPTPPYVAPPDTRTADVTQERASRDAAQTERKQVSKVEIVISFALAQQGKRYVWGAAGPNTFDCSGLVLKAFAQIGMSLYHYTGEMMKYGQRVSRAGLQRGDIVFPTSGHVGIYLGNNSFIHASSGKGKVAITALYSFYTARRLM